MHTVCIAQEKFWKTVSEVRTLQGVLPQVRTFRNSRLLYTFKLLKFLVTAMKINYV